MQAAKSPPLTRAIFLERFQSLRLLGEGGMGQVYYGRDLETNREVVIKVMHDHLAEVPAIRQNFERELSVMKRFRHPHSVELIDGSMTAPGRHCLVMEYIKGVDLEHHVGSQGPIPLRQVGWWLAQLCTVLYAAHQSNILHRDLTLNNLMLVGAGTDDEIIKVMDFGLAQLASAYFIPFEKLTGSHTSIGGGTPDYVAPEQVRGEHIDHRADLYSVGVVLYRLLSGWLPFQEFNEVNQLLEAHRSRVPPTFAQRGVTDIPDEIEAIVRLLLSKIPSERPKSAMELGLMFEEALNERIFPDGAFDFHPLVEAPTPKFEEKFCLDRMQAFFPEQIAIMKLRGFADSMGGEIAESEPGRIRIRLLDPRCPPPRPSPPTIFKIFHRRTVPVPQNWLHLDLFMEKRDDHGRSTVEIAVVMQPDLLDTCEQAKIRAGFGQHVCRELRAFLMIGR